MIIDTHLHLIDKSALNYPWLGMSRRSTATFCLRPIGSRPNAAASRQRCTWKWMLPLIAFKPRRTMFRIFQSRMVAL